MKLHRVVRTIHQPTATEVEHVVRTAFGSSRGKLPPGLLRTDELAGNANRRQLLKGLAAASAVGLVAGTSGCDEDSSTAILQAIEVIQAIFLISEQILGAFTLVNDGQGTLNLEVLVDLIDTAGDVVDGIACIEEIASGTGMVDVSWCEGLLADETGAHTAEGTEGGNPPVSTDIFQVEEEPA